MLWLIFTCFFLTLYTILLLLYSYWWSKTNHSFQRVEAVATTRFSIVIPARNEALNITACLQSIAQLEYPKELFEVIVVDDFSTDGTVAIAKQFSFVKVIALKNHLSEKINSYKKKALDIGIAAATNEFIVSTDADCIVPAKWLSNFNYLIKKKPTVFMAAPVAIKYECSPITIFQSLDFLSLQGITAASVGAGFHSMCNGANLCYSKKAFYAVNGFQGVDDIASGDDMLLMHKLYKKYPQEVHYCKTVDSIVYTNPVNSIGAFFRQRIRWASKANRYDDKRIFTVLLLVYMLNAWLMLLAISCFFIFNNLQLLLISLCIKTAAELFFLFPVARFFKKQNLLWWFVIAQPFHIIYIVVAGWLGKFGKYEWKGRIVQ